MEPKPRWLYTARAYNCDDPKLFVGPHELKFLANGAFSTVWEQPDGTILKVAKERDGTYGYLLWAQALERAFGLNSDEMQGVPRVHAIGLVDLADMPAPFEADPEETEETEGPRDGWWAVLDPMERCTEESNHDFDAAQDALEDTIQYVNVMFDNKYIDMHSGNVMYDPARMQYILTDPFCSADDMDGTHPPLKTRAEALTESGRYRPKRDLEESVAVSSGPCRCSLCALRGAPDVTVKAYDMVLNGLQMQRLGDPREAKGFT